MSNYVPHKKMTMINYRENLSWHNGTIITGRLPVHFITNATDLEMQSQVLTHFQTPELIICTLCKLNNSMEEKNQNHISIFFITLLSYDVPKQSSASWPKCGIRFCTLNFPHYHHYADVSERIELIRNRYIVSSVCLRLSRFSQLDFMQYMGPCVFSLSIFHVVIVRICDFYLIIIIKLKVRTVCYCVRIGHETMVCAECSCVLVYLDIGWDQQWFWYHFSYLGFHRILTYVLG